MQNSWIMLKGLKPRKWSWLYKCSSKWQKIMKCIFKTDENGDKSCDEEAKKCLEITFGGSDTICDKAEVSDNNKYKCVAESGRCKEAAKTGEKNGANYVKLSLGLLSLLFF